MGTWWGRVRDARPGEPPLHPGGAPASGSSATPGPPPLQLAFCIPRPSCRRPPPPTLSQAAHPTPKAAAQGVGLGQAHIPLGTKRFFSSHDRLCPASPTSRGGRGTQRNPPEERNPKLQARLRPAWPARGWGQDQGGQGGCGTDADKWVLPLCPTAMGGGCGHRRVLPQVSHLPNDAFIVLGPLLAARKCFLPIRPVAARTGRGLVGGAGTRLGAPGSVGSMPAPRP